MPRRPPSDSDSPPFGVSEDAPRGRKPTPVLGVEEVGASLGDVGKLAASIHGIERVLVDVVGLNPGESSGRLGRLEDDVDKVKTDVEGLTTWRTTFSAKLSVLIAVGIAGGSVISAIALHMIEKALGK